MPVIDGHIHHWIELPSQSDVIAWARGGYIDIGREDPHLVEAWDHVEKLLSAFRYMHVHHQNLPAGWLEYADAAQAALDARGNKNEWE